MHQNNPVLITAVFSKKCIEKEMVALQKVSSSFFSQQAKLFFPLLNFFKLYDD